MLPAYAAATPLPGTRIAAYDIQKVPYIVNTGGQDVSTPPARLVGQADHTRTGAAEHVPPGELPHPRGELREPAREEREARHGVGRLDVQQVRVVQREHQQRRAGRE